MDKEKIITEAVELLCRLIATPRVSRDETAASDIMEQWMKDRRLSPLRSGNNLLLVCPDYRPGRETVMLNAHIDTVRPVASWTRDPHSPDIEGDRLYGIGSNDCGGGLVTLLQVYRILAERERTYNLVYLASCEEEVSGVNGIRRVIPELQSLAPGIKVDVAIVGEPTGMQPAIAEKGLMVIDMTARGKSGHAARNEGVNAIYEALDDMLWIRSHRFGKISELLGPTLMSLTVVNAGTQHNVVPDECRMVIDVRSNEHYTNEEIFDEIGKNVKSEIKARSFHLHSSHISPEHPLIKKCVSMGMTPFGSPTLSDQALMPWQSFKLGPGDSARSHSADEYIRISELRNALDTYLELLG